MQLKMVSMKWFRDKCAKDHDWVEYKDGNILYWLLLLVKIMKLCNIMFLLNGQRYQNMYAKWIKFNMQCTGRCFVKELFILKYVTFKYIFAINIMSIPTEITLRYYSFLSLIYYKHWLVISSPVHNELICSSHSCHMSLTCGYHTLFKTIENCTTELYRLL